MPFNFSPSARSLDHLKAAKTDFGFDLDYLPEELRGQTYYRPSGAGEEQESG